MIPVGVSPASAVALTTTGPGGSGASAARPTARRPRPDGLPDDAEVVGRASGENFPVALRILPATLRHHLLAVYGYARLVDQLGDDYRGDRLGALDWVESELAAALADVGSPAGTGTGLHPLVLGAARTTVAVGADPGLLHDLIEANRRDQTVATYATFDDLVDYCRLSANPVGRLVLAVFAVSTPGRAVRSDAVCTALQLAEHLQDIAEDADAGRMYLPEEDLARFGVDPASLRSPGPATPAQRALIAFEVARARRLLDEGAVLVDDLRGWSRLAISAFVAGGVAALDAVADAGFDPLVATPDTRVVRVASAMARTWSGHRRARR